MIDSEALKAILMFLIVMTSTVSLLVLCFYLPKLITGIWKLIRLSRQEPVIKEPGDNVIDLEMFKSIKKRKK